MDPYHETYQGTPEQQPELNEIPIARMVQLEKQYRNGANWFYWIAGLSALSSVLLLIGSSFISAITLGSTEFLIAIGTIFPELAFIAAIAGVVIVGVFALMGYLSSKGHGWAYIVGIILFALDSLLLIWVKDFFGLAFHGLVLYFLITGVVAFYKLKKLLRQCIRGSRVW